MPSLAYISIPPGELQNLDPPQGGQYYLSGSYAVINDWDNPPSPPPASPDANFPFFRADDGFEAAMAYYWIDWCQTYVQDIAFDSACNRAILIDPHGYSGSHNASYGLLLGQDQPGFGRLRFGDGGVDAAEDAEAILHEYGHAIFDNIAPDIFDGDTAAPWNQSRALDEGSADYWGASMTDSLFPTSFPSAYFAEWWAHETPLSPLHTRRLDTGKNYGDSVYAPYDSAHVNGEIWSGCLWELMQQVGKRITDSLLLCSILRMRADLIENPTFPGAAWTLDASINVATIPSHTLLRYPIPHLLFVMS